ncbi:MAG: hypothetical protein M1827_003120 [Pycnora praestabilis]|nr:MAG: hypothetical protein M1827_003120 [Pycnora praestabilis]
MQQKNWMLGEDFNIRGKHHESIKALWDTKWKFPCKIGVYPFHDGSLEDFEMVFDYLIKNSINDAYSDTYTEAFFPTCESLLEKADSISASGNHNEASALYLRVACLYRISRFPIMNSPVKWKAWEAQKAAYMKAATKWAEPVHEELIPHTAGTGTDGPTVPLYVRLPSTASAENPVPTILLITGLDGYRPDNTQRSYEFVRRGWGCVIAEIPGTADSPADPKDAKSPDRLWDSVLDWMGKERVFDMGKVVAWGLSCGGYYAVRIAHTHKERLRGSVAQGAGVHHFFDRQWLAKADDHEYPFDLNPALAQKFGYSSVQEFKELSQKKFSLVDTGIVKVPSTRLLLINGTKDGLMPIEDTLLLFEHGTPKEARIFPNLLHMGYPDSNASVYPWLEDVMA